MNTYRARVTLYHNTWGVYTTRELRLKGVAESEDKARAACLQYAEAWAMRYDMNAYLRRVHTTVGYISIKEETKA